MPSHTVRSAIALLAAHVAACLLAAAPFTAADLSRLRSVTGAALSPDGRFLAYTVENNDTAGTPYSQTWVYTVATGASAPLTSGHEPSSEPTWSPDSSRLAYAGRHNGKSALLVTPVPRFAPRFLAELDTTNSPLPSTGARFAWSPDSRRIAFVSAVPGPETAQAAGDPVVITRYLYKPDAAEGNTRFNDNKRLHIFLVEAGGGPIRTLTSGVHYEHSIDWSPNGEEIAFVSNREPNEDQFFNYDLFTLRVADLSIRRLTATENIEYRPRWSPDGRTLVYQGCKRGLTDLETTMEDTHTWAVNADGTNRRELVPLDNRQGEPLWAPEGDAVYFTVRQRGNTVLYRAPFAGGPPTPVIDKPGTVGAFSIGRRGQIAYAYSSASDSAQLFLDSKQLTHLNSSLLAERTAAPTESFRFISNDNKWEVEAFLTRPAVMTPGSKHPMITVIHGGPHSMQGPAFNLRHQVYASKGWATLMVNYRGSTGYGQAFADAVFGDQNGNEAQDVLYAVSAALRRNLWIDRDRLGVEGVSYGGQLSAWLITQTRLFKSAIPAAAIINLVSYNYTTYYNQYEQMTFGIFPHQANLMDTLWERSSLRYAARAATPTLLIHGENDNDVPISEAEQFYIALKDVGVETVFVRYPREGHGLREVNHIIDWTNRSIQWHESHFPR